MRRNSNSNYFRKIQEYITLDKFKTIENGLISIPENQLEALWNLLFTGYSIHFAIQNYKNLYEYARQNSLDYPTALETFYSISFGLYAGIYLNETKWFELN